MGCIGSGRVQCGGDKVERKRERGRENEPKPGTQCVKRALVLQESMTCLARRLPPPLLPPQLFLSLLFPLS